jgi:hypothetical protein
MSSGSKGVPRGWLPLTAASLLLGILVLWRAPFQVDDAFITYRYAANLALHGTLAFNRGEAPVEGFSSPAWMLVLAGCALLFGKAAIPDCAIALGFVGAAVALFLLRRLVSAVRSADSADGRTDPRNIVEVFSVFWLLVTPAFIRYAGTGLEHPWFLASILGVACACACRLPFRFGIACAALAPWIRPEGAWIAVASAAQCWAAGSGSLSARLRDSRIWAIALAAGAGQLAVSGVRWVIFADVAPNTYWAKPSDLGEGLRYVRETFGTAWGCSIALAAILGVVFGSRVARGYAAAAVAWTVAAWLEGGDWMPDGRLLLPGMAMLIAAGAECGRAVALGASTSRASKARLLLVAGTVLFGVVSAAARSRTVMELDLANFRSLAHEQRVLGQWLRAARARSAALVDIGELGFLGEQAITDLAGLTDRVIAHSPGLRLAKLFDLSYLFEQRHPDVIVLRLWSKPTTAILDGTQVAASVVMGGIEERIAADDRLGRDYRLLFAQLPYQRVQPYYGRLVYGRGSFHPAVEVPERIVYVEELPRN